MATAPKATTPTGVDGTFELTFDGVALGLMVTPPRQGGDPVSDQAVFAALENLPVKGSTASRIASAIKNPQSVPMPVGEIEVPHRVPDGWFVAVSPNRLRAYLVPVPKRDNDIVEETTSTAALDAAGMDAPADAEPDPDAPSGPEINAFDAQQRLTSLRITSGILGDVLAAFGENGRLTDVTCVAQGIAPTPGQDAQLEYTFDEDPKFAPQAQEDGKVDLHDMMRERFVESGALLLTRQEPVEGEDGTDIYGKAIPCPPVKDAELDALAGNGTEVDGETIVAKRAGRPVKKNNRLEVLPVYEVSSDLDYSVGNLRFPGDIIIKGDVRAGFEIIATGSVTIGGVCEDSSVTAGADIILNGVVGNEHTRLEAGGNITAKFINSATVEVGEELNVANELINCTVTAKRVITTEKGRIVGGEITVEEEIDAGTLGSDEGIKTYLRVSPPDPRDKAGPVRARRRACPGVRVHIKLGMTNIEDPLPATSFWDVDGTVVKLKADADDAEPETDDDQEAPQALAS